MGSLKIINRDGLSNYHTHTKYCDGKNTGEEMVLKGVELGFRVLGFSGHQYSEPDKEYAMSPESTQKYLNEINNLKERYREKIEIYSGIERDSFSDVTNGFDYVIGSTHNIKVGDTWISMDHTEEIMAGNVEVFFDGDYKKYVKAYYEREADILYNTRGHIVGHFDLVSKFNKANRYFDEDSKWYRDAALEAAEGILDSFKVIDYSVEEIKKLPPEIRDNLGEGKPIFEINFGAMVNGWRNIPYPAPFIIDYLSQKGVPFILSSDCHNRDFLNYGFKEFISKYSD